MSKIKELEELLKKDVLVEIKLTIEELEEELPKAKKKKEIQEELKYMKEVQLYFDEVIIDIENNKLTEEQAIDILEGLEDMRIENQEI